MILFSHFVYRLLGEYSAGVGTIYARAWVATRGKATAIGGGEISALPGRRPRVATPQAPTAELPNGCSDIYRMPSAGASVASRGESVFDSPLQNLPQLRIDDKHLAIPSFVGRSHLSKKFVTISQDSPQSIKEQPPLPARSFSLPVRSPETANDLFVAYQKKNILRFIFVLFKRCEGVETYTSTILKIRKPLGVGPIQASVWAATQGQQSRPLSQELEEGAATLCRGEAHANAYTKAVQSFTEDNLTPSPQSLHFDISFISSYLLKRINLVVIQLRTWGRLRLYAALRQISGIYFLSHKALETPWLLQILFIPYVIFFGYFFTRILFQCRGDLFIYNIGSSLLASVVEAFPQRIQPLSGVIHANTFLQASVPGGAPLMPPHCSGAAAATGAALLMLPLRCVDFAATLGGSGFAQCVEWGLHFGQICVPSTVILATELLRGAHYASKIFLVWSFLTIWKGIRPGQSTKNEYTIQVRMNFKSKKRLSDLEGIAKFLPLLETCIQSLKPQLASGWQCSFARACGFTPITPLRSLREAESRVAQSLQGLEGSSALGGPAAERTWALPQLRHPQLRPHEASLSKYPKGYLFIGPPGTGKTLLAQAVAGEAGVPFIGLSASEIQKQISLGTKIGAVRLRNLFLQVKQHTPCILFFDEIDSIARRGSESMGADFGGTGMGAIGARSSAVGAYGGADNGFVSVPRGGAQASQSGATKNRLTPPTGDITLFTEFLIQMDGVPPGLVIIGTTNFLNHLDSAFIRSGRFDRILGLTYPGKNTRFDLLRLYTRRTGGYIRTLQSSWGEALPPPVAPPQQQRSPDRQLTSKASFSQSRPISNSFPGLMYFAEQTHGWTAADLATLVNESFLYLCRQKFLSEQANFFWQKHNGIATLSNRRSIFYQRKPTPPLVHTYKSLIEGMKKLSTREKYF